MKLETFKEDEDVPIIQSGWHLCKNEKDCVLSFFLERPKTRYEGGAWNSISGRYDSLNKAIESMGILPEPCRECSHLIETTFDAKSKAELTRFNLCFRCNFWRERLENQNPDAAIIEHHHWIPISENAKGSRGCGGRKHRIRYHDGREVVTTNLWHQGEIPVHFRGRMPNNAEFITP